MKYTFLILIFLTICLFNYTTAQFLTNTIEIEHNEDTCLLNNHVYLNLKIYPFLKNNEYFNELYDGITFIGSDFNPYIIYKPHRNIAVSIGWYGRIFNGREQLYINQIFYRLQYRLSSKLKLVMGQTYGHEQHKLIEPIYSFDNFYLQKPESGLQFLLNSKSIKSDLWLNWQKFILPGDSFKEEFVIGNSSSVLLYKTGNGSGINIPINFVAKHKGGQGTISLSPLQTYFNWSVGADWTFKINNHLMGIQSHYVQFNDVSDNKILRYTDGYGIYSNTYFQSKSWQIIAGYWFGEYYVSPLGEPLYQSLSKKYVAYQEPQKNLILLKIQYSYKSIKQCPLYIQFACYYDYQRGYFDFSYGLQLKFSEKFILLKDATTFE